MKRLVLLALLTALSLLSQSRMHSRAVNGWLNYCSDAGTTDDYTCTVGLIGYVTGQQFVLKPNTSNTGAATLNVDSLGAKTIVYNDSVTLLDNILVAGKHYLLEYDGTNMVLPFSSKFVLTNQANTYTAGAQTYTSAASLIVPNSGGYAPTANASLGFDTTQLKWVAGGTQATSGSFPRVLTIDNCTASSNCTGANQVDAAVQGTTETNFASNYSVPASFITSKKTLRVTAGFATTTTSGGPTVLIHLKYGTTVLMSMPAKAPAFASNINSGAIWTVSGTAAAGASVNVETSVIATAADGDNRFPLHGDLAQPVLVATNAAGTLQISAQWSAATAGNTIQLRTFIVEEIN